MIRRRPVSRLLLAATVLLAAHGFADPTWAIDDPYNEIGLFGGVGIPDENLVGQDETPGFVIGTRWRHVIYDPLSLSVMASFVPQYSGDLSYGDWEELQVGAALDWYFWRADRFRWYVSPGLGFMRLSPDFGDAVNRGVATLGIGQKIYPGEPGANVWWEFRLDPTAGKNGLNENTILQAKLLGGISWGVGGPAPDDDADGVPNRNDACPGTPAGATVDARGCPKDSDGDGVFDGLDTCPDTPAGWKVDAKGCPVDTDGDGVPDGGDVCPDTPQGAKVNEKGCPQDADKDGVFDGLDTCPDTPAGATVDAKGCPTDSDGDKVWDGLDRCPDTPRGTEVDANGCPVPVKAPALFTPEKKTLVLEGVNFENDRATLSPGSEAILDTVAASLRDWPDVRVEIGGHTDSVGSVAYNQRLSENRAKAVQDYLIAKGVPAGQMTIHGYGESAPITDNATEAGRAKNRRVELKKHD